MNREKMNYEILKYFRLISNIYFEKEKKIWLLLLLLSSLLLVKYNIYLFVSLIKK